MRVADFFCGGGGFSEGFRQAGFEIVFAVDKWGPAVKTYKGNKPGVNVIQDDVIRISELPDDEFEALVPDSEVIIGSPPCQSFSHSNKSGNADKSIGIQLIEAYLRIIARKKFKQESVLKYWILENVPAVKQYIKEEYSADDLGLEGDFVLRPHDGASGKYKEFRDIAKTGKEGSIFFFKDLWSDFLKQHQDNTPTDEETVDELRQRCPGEDLSLLLKQRDNEWVNQAKGHLKGNLNRFSRRLEDKRDANKPADLIERALSALRAVDCNQDSFTDDPHIEEMVKEINKITWEMKKKLERR